MKPDTLPPPIILYPPDPFYGLRNIPIGVKLIVRVGVIGCGWFGSAHARVYRMLGDAKLVAVMDVRRDIAKGLAEIYHVNYYTSIEDMIRKESLDAVSVAVTPQHLHQAAQEAMLAGSSVLVEKPVVTSREELSDLEAIIKKTDAIFMPGFIEVFNPAVRALKDILDRGDVGSLLSIWSRRVGRLPKKAVGWKIGVSLDLAIHEMYVQHYVTGEKPLKVSSYTAKLLEDSGEEDLAIFLSHYPNGVISTIETNWLTPSGIREALFMGDKGSLIVNYPEQIVRVELADKVEQPRIRKSEPLREELSYFVSHVKSGEDPEIGYEFAKGVITSIFTGLENKILL